MSNPTLISLLTATAGMIFFYLYWRSRKAPEKPWAEPVSDARTPKAERRGVDRRKASVALPAGQADRRVGPRRQADRGLDRQTQFGRKHFERIEFDLRQRERQLNERREELLQKLDSQGRRILEVDRLITNSALQETRRD